MTTRKKIRKRRIVFRDDDSYLNKFHFTGVTTHEAGPCIVSGTQVTESEGHPFSYNSSYKGRDIGGPFKTEKASMEDERGIGHRQPHWHFSGTYDVWKYQYHGPLYPVNPNHVESYPVLNPISDDLLMAWGTKAIARCKPTSSVAELSVAMGELMREGLPSVIGSSLWQSRLRDIRASGDEYLNVAFGWLPLINDVQSSVKAVTESEKIMRQYERDAGRVVRRRYEFPIEKETGPVVNYGLRYPQFASHNKSADITLNTRNPTTQEIHAWAADGNAFARPLYSTTTTETRRWFSGAFSYYLPTDYYSRDGWSRAAESASKLLGIELTPETLWNLAPWSWAADWFGNFGDVLANVSDYATDGLVLRYGYIMEETTMTTNYTLQGVHFRGYPPTNLNASFTRVLKRRLPATPFGFGLTFDGFSLRQQGILAALGITRLR